MSLRRVRNIPALQFSASKISIHATITSPLLGGGDFFVLDFEGEPAKPIVLRRVKQSPIKDVAE